MQVDTPELLASYGLFDDGKRVLDLGCGEGFFAWRMKELPISSYVGMDIRKDCVKKARQLNLGSRFSFHFIDVANSCYHPNGFQSAEEFSIPCLPEAFDSIICHSLFTHLETEQAASRYVSECLRALKPNGLLWTTWFRCPPNEPDSSALRTCYQERFIRELLSPFQIVMERNGNTDSYHDQWEILAKKP